MLLVDSPDLPYEETNNSRPAAVHRCVSIIRICLQIPCGLLYHTVYGFPTHHLLLLLLLCLNYHKS